MSTPGRSSAGVLPESHTRRYGNAAARALMAGHWREAWRLLREALGLL